MFQWRYSLTGIMFDSCSVSFLASPRLQRVTAVEWAVECESVFLEKSMPAWYLGNPDLSLHHFHLMLCLETSFIVFTSAEQREV